MKLLTVLFICGLVGVQSEEEFAPYIINGIRSPVAPYYAYIRFFSGSNSAWGGGALVTDRHIVTAATVVIP